MKRFKIITHRDLDGVGCAIVAKAIFNKQYVYTKFVDYVNVNEVVKDTLENEEWNHIFITDISVNEEIAELIENKYPGKVDLIDHHPGLDWLNKYSWAQVTPGTPNRPDTPSGTSLFFEFLVSKLQLKNYPSTLDLFVDAVRKYDTWIWHTIYHDEFPKKLNDYMGIIGFFDFMKEMIDRISENTGTLLNDNALLLLKYREKEIDYYIKTKNKNIIKREINGIRVGFVYAENYHSELGNKLIELNDDIDIVIIIDLGRNKLSIRSIEERNVDCTLISNEWYGGGGHKCASGAIIPSMMVDIVNNILCNKYK